MQIMLLLLLLISAFILSMAIRSDFSRSFGVYFALWWTVLFVVSMFNPYGVYPVSLEGYLILFSFVLFFMLGYLVVNLILPVNAAPKIFILGGAVALQQDFENLSKNRWVKFALVLVFLGVLYYFIKYLSVVMLGGVDIRSVRYEIGSVFESGFEAFLFDYIVGGLINVLKFFVAFGLVFSQKKSFLWLISLAICTLYMAFGLGRYIVVEIGVFVVYLLLIAKHFNYKTNFGLNNSGFVFFVFVLYLFSVIATMLRGVATSIDFNSFIEANSILLEHSVLYFVGAFRAFDYAYQNFTGWFDYGNGLMTFGGIDEIFSLLGKFIGFNTIPYVNYWGGVIAEPINIGDAVSFNALYTSVFNFYFDFEFFGVVGFSFLFGGICAFSVIFYLRRLNLSMAFASALLFNFAIMSCLAWRLAKGPAFIVLILAFLIGLKNKAKLS